LNYTPLRITTLKPDRDIPFGLFIYFKEQYIEYLIAGHAIEKDKFKKLRKQKISKFYILDKDEGGYQKYLDQLLDEVLTSSDTSTEEKVEIVEGQTLTALEKMQDDPGSQESFNMTRKAAQNLRRLIFDNPQALAGVFGSKTESEPIVKHCLNVCAMAIKYATTLELDDEKIDFISTASLMHDIGITQLTDEEQLLFNKKKSDMTLPEKNKYYEHCNQFLDLLRDKPYVNEEVLHLIENHEEVKSGQGPHKKKKLTQSEEIISICNTYDKKMIEENLGPEEAMKKMMIDELGNYDLDTLKNFHKFLKSEKYFQEDSFL
jgi:HD-GYP domain-containing protein (c-di-GMP phosphodiesterase class II)